HPAGATRAPRCAGFEGSDCQLSRGVLSLSDDAHGLIAGTDVSLTASRCAGRTPRYRCARTSRTGAARTSRRARTAAGAADPPAPGKSGAAAGESGAASRESGATWASAAALPRTAAALTRIDRLAAASAARAKPLKEEHPLVVVVPPQEQADRFIL